MIDFRLAVYMCITNNAPLLKTSVNTSYMMHKEHNNDMLIKMSWVR